VRDYLESIGWNKQAPAPALPDDVVAHTREKYMEAFRLLTGRDDLEGIEGRAVQPDLSKV
jgi:phosphoribosylaminoimidazole-succinocarboxamide synthase